MDHMSNLDLQSDLLFKNLKYEWQFNERNISETPEKIIQEILSENVGIALREDIIAQQLGKLKVPLKKMMNKKVTVNSQFEKMVASSKKEQESGPTIGILIFSLLQKLVPLDLIGGHHNRFYLLKAFRKALKSGKKDTVPLKTLVTGLKLKQVQWLKSVECDKSKTIIVAKLVKWLWKVTKSLIASKYYVTEIQGSFKLVYIPKKVWQSKTDKVFNLMIHQGVIKPLSEEESKVLEAQRQPASLRWLPKGDKFRPIIYLRNGHNKESRLKSKKEDSELKAFLRHLVSNIEEAQRIAKPQQLHAILKCIVKKQEIVKDQRHLIKVDVRDAYGSIFQNKLVAIVKKLTSLHYPGDKNTCFVKFKIMYINRKQVLICEGLFEDPKQFLNGYYVKLVRLYDRMEKIILCQTVKRMKTLYLLKKGISQAVPVSAALCDLYLSYLTKTHLSQFTANNEDTLIRAMDDFLYVTPNRDRAQLFLKTMSAGFPDFNIHVNKEKTQSTLAGSKNVEYFGFIFDPSLGVQVKYSGGADITFRYSFTLNQRMTPLETLKDKMFRIPNYKLSILTLDPMYISTQGACRNIFHTACFMACCFKAIVDILGSTSFTRTQLLDCISSTSTSLACRVFRIRKKNDIFIRELSWIVLRAFQLCFSHCGRQESNDFPGALLPNLLTMEQEARSKVRLKLIETISSFVKTLPSQFTAGY